MSQVVKAIRHFGIFRPGVTREQAMLDRKILVTAFRKGTLTEGKLSNFSGRLDLADDAWKSAMARLESYGLVEFGPAIYGNARTVSLTKDGRGWAMDLACEAQVQESEAQDKARMDRLRAEQAASRPK